MLMKSTISIIMCLFVLVVTGCSCGTDSHMFINKDDTQVTASSRDAIAETFTGKVAGYIENGLAIFKGIPYATAQRFELPQRPVPWEGYVHKQ